jgi:hypothetical protein
MGMKKFALSIVFTLVFTLLAAPAWATTYYLAPASGGGNDSNNGTSASTPWLTPNHPVNCGDVIIAAASTAYVSGNFNQTSWGAVTCPAGNNVAWLQCATFDACKITATSNSGMWVASSYWGVQGWEVSTSGTPEGPCFFASANSNSGPSVSHIIFANDIANGCMDGGFATAAQGAYGPDYLVIVGDAIYNAAAGSSECFSGVDIGGLVNADTQPGTHVYIAGNYIWNNQEPVSCGGGAPTDGAGIILDSLDGNSYTQQVAIENNISFLNGSSGVKIVATTEAAINIVSNTIYGNDQDTSLNQTLCGEITLQSSNNTSVYYNLVRTIGSTGCGLYPNYVFFVQDPCLGDAIHNNFGYSAAGYNADSASCSGFTFGPNYTFGVDPGFVSAPPSNPGAPNCGAATSVPNCMAAVIAGFTPQAASAAAYGYQAPTAAPINDPLFPQWLCNVNLPAGLITMGCLSASSLPASPTITNAAVR